jgi:CRP-like cAMP-binding protein
MGAQLTFVVQHFDALLFSRLAQTKPVNAFMKALFTSTRGPLGKYLHVYKKGEEIFHQGEMSKEVYYIMKGEAAVFLHDQQVSVVGSGKFFGEMGHILGEQRSATMKAHTDLDTLVLSPSLFEEVLHSDPDIDKRVINTFSRRLKDSNKKISSDSVLSEAAPEESKPRKKAKKRKKR